jgi:hypothetical protein
MKKRDGDIASLF